MLQSRITDLQEQLLSTDAENKKAVQVTVADRDEDLKTITKLEKMVERFRSESQKVLNDHLKLQSRYQDASGQQEKLKQRIMQLDVELRQMYENSNQEKAALQAALESERQSRKELAAHLKIATEQLAKESDARDDADRSANETQRQLTALQLSTNESEARVEKSARVIQELKEQVRFLTATIEEQRVSAQQDADAAAKEAERAENAARAHERQISLLESEIIQLKGKLEAAKGASERYIADAKANAEETQLHTQHLKQITEELQKSQITERTKANQALATLLSEKESLTRKVLELEAALRTAEEKEIASSRAVNEAQSLVETLEHEKSELIANLHEHINSSNNLCTKLASVEGQLTQSALDETAAHGRLQSLHSEVTQLQKNLAEVTLERERYRDAMNALNKECSELHIRLEERNQATSDNILQLKDLSERNDSLTSRMNQTATDRAVYQEKIESLEHRIAQLKAEKDLALADALKVSRESQRQAVAHSQELDDLRHQCEQSIADAARVANKQLQDALLDAQQKRQTALSQALSGIDSDPRVRRAFETEEKNIQLQNTISELKDNHSQEMADKERTIKKLESELRLKDKEGVELRRDRDREREIRRAHDDSNSEYIRNQYHLQTEFSLFIQNSEMWLREVLQKVALLTIQKLHHDFIVSAQHRHQLFQLNGRLRDAEERIETTQEALQESNAKIASLKESLKNEVNISKELNNKYAGRNQNMSPLRGTPMFKGTLSSMAANAERIDNHSKQDDSFVLLTRWDLVSALFKQDIRCEAANESATSLFRLWRSLGDATHQKDATLSEDMTLTIVDLVELVQSIANAQSHIARSFFTDKEKAFLHDSKNSVLKS